MVKFTEKELEKFKKQKIEEIDRWLENEYGVSYTRLEELHDFVIEQDMKHQEEKDKEIKRLKGALQTHEILLKSNAIEIERLNNIINKIEEHFVFLKINSTGGNKEFFEDILDFIKALKKLKGSDEE